MKTKKRIIPALVLSLFATFGSTASSAAQFSNVYVFGDSLSDAGYFRPFLSSLGLPPSLVATLGRFTINPGPVWAELVAAHYGVANPGPSNAGGTIYAQGGARVALPSPSATTPPGFAQRPVSTQIDEFLAAGGGAADPNALYAVFAGGNDMLTNIGLLQAGAITSAQFQTNVLAAATAEVGQVARLRAAGARYILVFALPDVGNTPSVLAAGAATAASISQLAAGYNTTLFSGLAGAGLRVIPVDTFGLFTDVRVNAAAFGFTNTTGVACTLFAPTNSNSSQFCTNATIVPGGQSYLFADSVHPTPRAQAILADYVQGLIDGPSQYSLLAETPLRMRAAHVRTLAEGGSGARGNEVGKIGAFAAFDGSDFDIDAGQGLTGQSTHANTFTVGLVARASESFTIGIAAGKSRSKANFGSDAGGYRADEETFSLFGGFRGERLYALAAFSFGDIDFNDTRRNVKLGSVTRIAESRPQGSNASGFATVGYDWPIGRFTIGPTVGVAVQNVDVQAFDETAAGGAPNTGMLSIGQQTRRSEVWSVGGRVSYDFGNWTPWARVTADKERRDDPRFVTATVVALGSIGGAYEIEGYASDSSFITAAAGVRGKLNDWVSVGISFFKVSGRGGIKEDGVTGAVAIRF